jgi:hypothetical protein
MVALPLEPEDPITALRRAIYAHGFQPVPVKTNEKAPINRAWTLIRGVPPLAHITRNTGINCSTIRAIDIDIDDPDAAQKAVALSIKLLGSTPLIRFRSNSPRRLLVYRGSGPKRIIKTTAGKVEVLGAGQQFVAFGVHPDGSEFDWEGETPATFSLADLPEVSSEVEQTFAVALIEALGGPVPVDFQPSSVVPIRAPTRAIEAWAQAALDAETREVASCGKGGRNDTLNKAAFSLGQLVGGGYLQEADIVSALRNAALACGLAREDGWPATNATIRSGLSKGRLQPRQKPERDIEVPVTVVEAAAAMSGARAKKPDPVVIDLGASVDWAKPVGLLSEIANWILATSPMPNRPLAVAAATAIISTICGRHLYSASATAMNLYIAMLAKTGVGKDRPLSAPGEIFKAAGMPSLRQSGKSFAVSGFESMMVDNPCCVAIIDELGANLMSRISHRRSSTHEQAIKPLLLELWSRTMGKDAFMTTHRAQSASVPVRSPSLTILGASTPEKFYATLQNADAADGFMNRFLIAEAAPRCDEDEDIETIPVPQIVIDCLHGIVPALGGSLGNVLGVFSPNVEVPERKLEWAYGVRDAVKAFKKQVNEVVTEAKYGDLWGRVYEYSIRLGGIHAVSRAGAYAELELVDMQWGAAWAVSSAKSMSDAAENMMAKSGYEAELNDVKKEIRDAGVITRSQLLRAIRHINGRDLENITNHLAGAGIVERQETKGVGRPLVSFRWKG